MLETAWKRTYHPCRKPIFDTKHDVVDDLRKPIKPACTIPLLAAGIILLIYFLNLHSSNFLLHFHDHQNCRINH
jgi:hypothetical protein